MEGLSCVEAVLDGTEDLKAGCRSWQLLLGCGVPALVHVRTHHLVALNLLVVSRRLGPRPSSGLNGGLALRRLGRSLHCFLALRSRPLRPLPLRTGAMAMATIWASCLILLVVGEIACIYEGVHIRSTRCLICKVCAIEYGPCFLDFHRDSAYLDRVAVLVLGAGEV